MSITLLSVNSAQQPKRIPGAMGDQDARSKELAKNILDQKPDIVCIQELFRRKSQVIVYKSLKEELPYFYIDTDCGKWAIGVNSGLAIFSKFPLLNKELKMYNVYRGVENFAKKSLMHVTAKINKDTSVEVFTTHLQTGIGAEPCICKIFDKNSYSSNQIKKMQVQDIVDWSKKYSQNPILLAGDFNTRAGTELYDSVSLELEDGIQVEDVFDSSRSPCDSSVVGKSNRRIDYVWTNIENAYYIILEPWRRQNALETSSKVNSTNFVTDHHAIVSYIRLK